MGCFMEIFHQMSHCSDCTHVEQDMTLIIRSQIKEMVNCFDKSKTFGAKSREALFRARTSTPESTSVKRVFPGFRKWPAEMFGLGVYFSCVVEHFNNPFLEPTGVTLLTDYAE